MSGFICESLKIAVTGGDALPDNRENGKSNTGTYFISSLKDFDKFSKYFANESFKDYVLDSNKMRTYCFEFETYCLKYKNEFQGKMESFQKFKKMCFEDLGNPTIGIGLRINDSRVFMKFANNSGFYEKIIRGLAYSKLTNIVLENRDGINFIYLEINHSIIENESSQIIFE